MKEITLTSDLKALVDDNDFEIVSDYKWYPMKVKGYSIPKAVSSNSIAGKTKLTLMHRLVMNAKKGEVVDHINGNPLDNRKENLRICTQAQNARNTIGRKHKNSTSKYKGVRLHWSGRWEAQIMVDGRTKYLGYWDTEDKAATVYNLAAKDYHGIYARLNAFG